LITGIPLDTQQLLNRLFELKAIANQMYETGVDIFWDVVCSNFAVKFGDDHIQVQLIGFDRLSMTTPEHGKHQVGFTALIKGIQGTIIQKKDEHVIKEPISEMFDFTVNYSKILNPAWQEGNVADQQFLQSFDIETKPAVSINIKPAHFNMIMYFLENHIKILKETFEKMIEEVKKKKRQIINSYWR